MDSRKIYPDPTDIGSHDNPLHGEKSQRRHRRYVTKACESCRATKTKCDGNDPCGRCTGKDRLCHYSDRVDLRNRDILKRKIEELTRDNLLLHRSLDDMRHAEHVQGSGEAMQELHKTKLNIPPSKSRPDERLTYAFSTPIKSTSTSDAQPVQDSVLSCYETRLTESIRRNAVSIASLIDEPPIRVPAQPWTNVTTDDYAVSHLVSVFFTWQYHQYPAIIREVFVREMNDKNLSSQFCSPLLVNTILLNACMYTDNPCAFANPNDPSSRALHYLEEATKLWNTEKYKVSLTTHQAFTPMMASHVLLGRDRTSVLYMGELFALETELVMKVKAMQKQGVSEFTSDDFERSYSASLWASYVIRMEIALAWLRTSDTKKPTVTRPFIGEDLNHCIRWRPYPNSNDETSLPHCMVNDARYDLSEITAMLIPVSISGNPQDSPLPGSIVLELTERKARLETIDEALTDWEQSLSPGLRLEDFCPAKPVVALQDLHLMYLTRRIQVQSLLRKDLKSGDVDIPTVEQKLLQYCKHVTDFCVLINYSGYQLQATIVAAYAMLDFLERPGVCDTFHILVEAQAATARRWQLVKGILKMLWHTLQEQKLMAHLTPATLAILRFVAVESWGALDHCLFEGSSYPNLVLANKRGRQFAEMSDLLLQYSSLELEDS